MTYQSKEIAVFGGILGMIEEGRNLYTITVSDIAEAAGIGKGTVYEYFSSKEEIFKKTILYIISNVLEEIERAMDQEQDFRGKYYAFMELVEHNQKTLTTLQFMFTLLDKRQAEKMFCGFSGVEEQLKYGFSLIDRLLDCAQKEHLCSKDDSTHYKRMAVYASVSSYIFYLFHPTIGERLAMEQAKEDSYKMLVRSLGGK